PMSASLWYTPSVPSLIPPVIFGAATLSITVSVPGWNFLRHFILQLAEGVTPAAPKLPKVTKFLIFHPVKCP
ncbi:MAG: hypothetical protein IKP40_12100, partial [Clostridia bacterium]|nr:hypothetical protein [Clostridia bacterium]